MITVPMKLFRTSDDLDKKAETKSVTLVVDHSDGVSQYRGEFTLKGLSAKELVALKKAKSITVTVGK